MSLAHLAQALAGQFAIERELGRGGMGVVFLGRDLKLDRPVAIKTLPPERAGDPETRERFLREARTAARLSHPNVVPVYRADEVGGTAFFVMAYVDGESLGDRVRDRGPLPPAEAVRILREVAWALAYAHARGVVHRDVKPENILLERGSGRAMVTDFGIARGAVMHQGPTGAADLRLTQTGQILGSVHYMSPEQATGSAELDGRSDLYALGVVAFHLLSGRLPFEGLAAPAVIVANATRPAPPLRTVAPSVPAALAMVVDRCLAKLPEERYATGEALADALAAALEDAREGGGPALPPGVPPVLSEEQAAALWSRAAQLQSDALRRLEARRDLLPRETTASAGLPAAPQAGAGPGPTPQPTSGYRLADVVAAAQEAGISGQYVAMALAELPQGGHAAAVAGSALGVSERQATLFLGTEERSLGVSVVVPAPPARTLRALGTVLQQGPYELRLRETVGAHPLDGGVLVFDLPSPTVSAAGQPVAYWMSLHVGLEARQVQVTLRPLPGEPARTEVTMLCDVRPGVRRNVRVSQWIAGVLGGIGGGIAAAVSLTPVLALGALAALPAAGAALLVAGGSFAGYRALYRNTLGNARKEMTNALEAVAASVKWDGVFGGERGS